MAHRRRRIYLVRGSALTMLGGVSRWGEGEACMADESRDAVCPDGESAERPGAIVARCGWPMVMRLSSWLTSPLAAVEPAT
jgi:hypothetical protein